MPEKPLEHKDIVELLAKLKEKTPEYPKKLAEAKKDSFLKQVLDISNSGSNQDNESGQNGGNGGAKGGSSSPSKSGGSTQQSGISGSGGPGAAYSGKAAGLGLGISLKSVLVFGAALVLLTTAYLLREQIGDILAGNEIVRLEETADPFFASSSADQTTNLPTASATPDTGMSSFGSGDDSTVNNNNNSDTQITGDSIEPVETASPPVLNQKPATLTPMPPDNSITGRLRYLVCILRYGTASCQ